MLGFTIGIKDIIDIIIISTLLFGAYRLLKRTGASNLFWGITAFMLISVLVSYVFELPMTGALFNRVIDVGAIAIIVIFQEEIRKLA